MAGPPGTAWAQRARVQQVPRHLCTSRLRPVPAGDPGPAHRAGPSPWGTAGGASQQSPRPGAHASPCGGPDTRGETRGRWPQESSSLVPPGGRWGACASGRGCSRAGRGGRLSRGRWGRRPSRGAAQARSCHSAATSWSSPAPSVPSSPLHPGCCWQLSHRPPPGAELDHPRGRRPCPPGVEAGAGAALAAMGGGPSGPAARSPSGETARPRHREGWAPTAVFQQRRGLQWQTGHAGGGAGHPGAPRGGGGPTPRPASAGARGTRREQVRELTRDPRARLHAGPRPGPPAR